MKKNWLILPVFLGAIALSLLAVLLGKFSREEKIFQEQIPLNGLIYDEAFLKEAEKLPGIQSVTPVVPLAVHLSMEEYSMDTELFGDQSGRKEIHGRRSDKACNKLIHRIVVKHRRGSYLLDHAFFHDNDPCPECHCLRLIMRHINDRGSKLFMKPRDLHTHLYTELCIQVG